MISAASAGPGWGDRPGGPPRAEPTALACLALRASARPDGEGDRVIAAATSWLAARRRPDGAVAMAADMPDVTWATPQAILALWGVSGCEFDGPRRG